MENHTTPKSTFEVFEEETKMNKLYFKIRKQLKKIKIILFLYILFCKLIDKYKTTKFVRNRSKNLQANGNDVLYKTCDIFNELGIKYFVAWGTLLGIVREQRLIKHDVDIDLGILDNVADVSARIRSEMEAKSFRKVRTFFYNDKIVAETYELNNVHVGFFYYEQEGNSDYFCYSFWDRVENSDEYHAYKHEQKINGFQKIIFNGQEICIPQEPEDLLSQLYGADWRIPNKNWEMSMSPTYKRAELNGTIVRHT